MKKILELVRDLEDNLHPALRISFYNILESLLFYLESKNTLKYKDIDSGIGDCENRLMVIANKINETRMRLLINNIKDVNLYELRIEIKKLKDKIERDD